MIFLSGAQNDVGFAYHRCKTNTRRLVPNPPTACPNSDTIKESAHNDASARRRRAYRRGVIRQFHEPVPRAAPPALMDVGG
ncbi:hypothetical protein EVAR_31183_1 [Eumeta japonica]|uniref:Uncharacterized protein n=1 Tax=Eumeta variegata TaxID=151549 RepID=A0A4C1VYH4_EUMVA|nr:hypothetical protein EVAR_31183_1 [Eumeta japonica]